MISSNFNIKPAIEVPLPDWAAMLRTFGNKMKRMLPLIYGWIGAALFGGIFITTAFWIHDSVQRELSTFRLTMVVYQALLMALYVGVIMIPGVILAAIFFFRSPQFRGRTSLALACGTGLVIMLCLFGFTNLFRNADFQIQVFLSLSAVLVAGLFWWITQKAERVE